jgi:acyl-CoA reductase-like NAD-dependent aldehyde dehydrogenase
MNPHERTLVLLRVADAIEANREELAILNPWTAAYRSR